ncbi:unnamed protein product [Darwinula stevensoni]|uniref:Sterol carrier protein 2 n=1 Tax=Darwinula stevensoni TaxID=69355 RepID=A0A7R8X985_9CRUS|nr:unnamed protein product [Darwinula stevensoni]CAG0890854.1 unnamed protein product [Darwinula stevensoni]
MGQFEKPGRRPAFDYPDMVRESVGKALQDAKLAYGDVQQACVGYVYGDSTCGQRALYEVGLTGIPIYNVNNNCSTGSTALLLAKQLIEGGQADCILAVGFEKMDRGSLTSKYEDRTNPLDRHVQVMADSVGIEAAPMAPQMFGNAGKEHMQKYGTNPVHFAKIAYKNHKHSVNNPYSQFQTEYSLDEILGSPMVFDPLTKLQCCPTSDGSAAAILASEDFIHSRGLEGQAVEILGMEMVTDFNSTFQERSMMNMVVGYDMTKNAAERLYLKTGCRPSNVDVVELHDCFSANELITYEALGLCPPGKAGLLVDTGNNTYGGKYVINPSGGLISKGHPLGATGLAQCAELCWQLRGEAGKRQVPGAKLALQHNIGLGGAVVVGLYAMGFPRHSSQGDIHFNQTSTSLDKSSFKTSVIFDEIEKSLKEDGANWVKKVNGVYLFRVKNDKGEEGIWLVDAKNGNGKVVFGQEGDADVVLSVNDTDFFDLMLGKLNPQKAFFQGKLKVKGNLGLAMKLQEFQKTAAERYGTLTAKL